MRLLRPQAIGFEVGCHPDNMRCSYRFTALECLLPLLLPLHHTFQGKNTSLNVQITDHRKIGLSSRIGMTCPEALIIVTEILNVKLKRFPTQSELN